MREVGVVEGAKSNLSQWHSMIDDSVKLWNLGDEFFLKNTFGRFGIFLPDSKLFFEILVKNSAVWL